MFSEYRCQLLQLCQSLKVKLMAHLTPAGQVKSGLAIGSDARRAGTIYTSDFSDMSILSFIQQSHDENDQGHQHEHEYRPDKVD